MPRIVVEPHGLGWGAPVLRRPPVGGLGRARKIALLGGGKSTLAFAPWFDPTWELWAHASCRNDCVRLPDVLFDLHPPALWRDPVKKHWDTSYLAWLKQNTVPIYMQAHYPDVPASIKYPFGAVMTQFRPYFTNHVAWMTALALMEGVTQLALYGCHYSHGSEYEAQRGCAEYWCGVAEGRGVQVLIPPGCDLLGYPAELYGYESHPDGVRLKSYTMRPGKPGKADAVETPTAAPKPLTLIDPACDARPALRTLIGQDGTPVAPAWARSGYPEPKGVQ